MMAVSKAKIQVAMLALAMWICMMVLVPQAFAAQADAASVSDAFDSGITPAAEAASNVAADGAAESLVPSAYEQMDSLQCLDPGDTPLPVALESGAAGSIEEMSQPTDIATTDEPESVQQDSKAAESGCTDGMDDDGIDGDASVSADTADAAAQEPKQETDSASSQVDPDGAGDSERQASDGAGTDDSAADDSRAGGQSANESLSDTYSVQAQESLGQEARSEADSSADQESSNASETSEEESEASAAGEGEGSVIVPSALGASAADKAQLASQAAVSAPENASATSVKTAASAKASKVKAAAKGVATSKVSGNNAKLAGKASKPSYAGVGVTYDVHVQNIGWQAAVANGKMAGTSGRSLRLEGIHISLTGANASKGGVKYAVHVQNVGWQGAVANGKMAGTSGRSLRLEGIKIWLTGTLASHYDVLYRTHVQNVGWQGWVKNGTMAGTSGRSLRLEGIQIKLSPKTAQAAGKSSSTPSVRYESHVQNDGWQMWVADGTTSGTSGRSLRVEGLNIRVDGGDYSGGVEYQAHVQNVGWQGWKKDGAMAGTSGKSLRVEALRIRLTGDLAKHYDVYYRAHVEDAGWLDWAKNGAVAGTSNCAARMEALEIVLRPKNAKAPGDTSKPSCNSRWDLQETRYLDNSKVNELVEVKYTGGSNATVVVRQKKSGAWKTVLSTWGYVGRAGIGTASMNSTRTPQGNFGITSAFGIKSNPGAKMNYVKVNDAMWWCGDPAYYNQLIDMNQHPHYCAGEHLIDYAPDYNYGLFFDYNTNPIKYGAGAAFFVHCTGRNPYTGGCIAVPESKMKAIIRTIHKGSRLLIYPK